MNKLINYLSILIYLLFIFSSAFSTAGTVFAANPGPAGVLQLQQLIVRVINLSVGLAFIALTVVLVYAGIRFLTSGGDSKVLATQSNTVTWALLGILFLALAWLILKLIAVFTGVDITNFCIGFPGAPTGCL